jgi:hypothetical protein
MEEFAFRAANINSWSTMNEVDIMARYFEPMMSVLFEDSVLFTK